MTLPEWAPSKAIETDQMRLPRRKWVTVIHYLLGRIYGNPNGVIKLLADTFSSCFDTLLENGNYYPKIKPFKVSVDLKHAIIERLTLIDEIPVSLISRKLPLFYTANG